MPGSRSPGLVAIISPPSALNPIVVSSGVRSRSAALRQLRGDVLVRQTMKPVALDERIDVVRESRTSSNLRSAPMERGVQAEYLRNSR